MGFVKYLTVEQRYPGGPGDIEFDDPSLEQILNAISSMDGRVSSYVMLHPGEQDDNIFMAIGGGNEGRFLVCHWNGEQGIEQRVIVPSVTSNEYVDVMMVQLTERLAHEIVDLGTALKVATHFDTTGQLTTEVTWKID
jgi:hypothetical protein